MRCEDVERVLPVYVGEGEPYPRAVEVHLATCRSCAAEDARYLSVIELTRGLRDAGEPPPPELVEHVTEGLHRPRVAWRGHVRRISHNPRTRYAAAGLGGAVVGATAIAFLLRRTARRPAVV